MAEKRIIFLAIAILCGFTPVVFLAKLRILGLP